MEFKRERDYFAQSRQEEADTLDKEEPVGLENSRAQSTPDIGSLDLNENVDEEKPSTGSPPSRSTNADRQRSVSPTRAQADKLMNQVSQSSSEDRSVAFSIVRLII